MNQIVLIVLRPDSFSADAIRPDVLGIYPDARAADSAIERFIAVGRVLDRETVWAVPVRQDRMLGTVLWHPEYGYAEQGAVTWTNEMGQTWVAALFDHQHTVLPAEQVMVEAVR
jgi:hypothetical protein